MFLGLLDPDPLVGFGSGTLTESKFFREKIFVFSLFVAGSLAAVIRVVAVYTRHF